MDGDSRKLEIEKDLMAWQRASTICHDKLTALESLLGHYQGADRELFEVLVERERDICAQLRNRITSKLSELVKLGTAQHK
ncbi:MAG TPA: hypothetical protein VL918_03485 [Sphingobium sp.]|nr:hypothetical protein [Sphingobium sp.]